MCNCPTGYTGDSCQLRAFDEYTMFVTQENFQAYGYEISKTFTPYFCLYF